MKYSDIIASRMPSASFMLDQGAATIVDYSGNGNLASQKDFAGAALTISDITPNSIPSVSYASKGWRAVPTRTTEFAVSFLEPGTEATDISVETWVKLNDGAQADAAVPMGIFSRTPNSQGLWFDRKTVNFTVSFASAPSATVTWARKENKRIHLVATKSEEKIELYVDGYLADSYNLSPEQVSSKYLSSSGLPKMGSSTSSTFTGSVIGNATSLFKRVLTSEEVRVNHLVGIRGNDVFKASSLYGGRVVTTTISSDSIFDSFVVENLSDWESGEYYGLEMGDGYFEPEADAYTADSQPTWARTIPLGTIPADSLGYFFETDSDARLVFAIGSEPSLTGTSFGSGERFWNPTAAQHEAAQTINIALIWPESSLNKRTSRIRIYGIRSFTKPDHGGVNVSGELLRLSSLRHPMENSAVGHSVYASTGFTLSTSTVAFEGPAAQPTDSEIVDGKSVVIEQDPTEGSIPSNTGSEVPPEVTETIVPPEPEPAPTPIPVAHETEKSIIRTIEIWGVLDSPTSLSVTVGGTAVTPVVYTQGTTSPAHALGNELLHIVLAANATADINIRGVKPATVTVYPVALTAAQVGKITAGYFGVPSERIIETEAITVQEPLNSVSAYSYAWTSA